MSVGHDRLIKRDWFGPVFGLSQQVARVTEKEQCESNTYKDCDENIDWVSLALKTKARKVYKNIQVLRCIQKADEKSKEDSAMFEVIRKLDTGGGASSRTENKKRRRNKD